MTIKGLLFVIIQMLLLLVFIMIPTGFAEAFGWQLTAFICVVAGTLIAAAAMVQLGPGLTPMPVPLSRGKLITSGVYKFVRHPIYSGILLVTGGISLYSFNLPRAIITLLLLVLFYYKSKYEEELLKHKYSGYSEYMEKTGRFTPRLWK